VRFMQNIESLIIGALISGLLTIIMLYIRHITSEITEVRQDIRTIMERTARIEERTGSALSRINRLEGKPPRG